MIEKSERLYQVTYSKGEVCYLPPAGWISCERVLHDKDLIGFVLRGVSSFDKDKAYSELQLARKLLVAAAKDDKALGNCVLPKLCRFCKIGRQCGVLNLEVFGISKCRESLAFAGLHLSFYHDPIRKT